MENDDSQVTQKHEYKIDWHKVRIIAFITFVIAPILYWMLFLNHVSINEVGVAYNMISGEVTVQDRPGWYRTSPTTVVASISTLPFKVSVNSSATVINEKVIRFKPEGVQEYIRLQGFSWVQTNFENIMMGYAYSGRKWPFLEVIQEAGPENFDITKIDWQKSSEKKNEK